MEDVFCKSPISLNSHAMMPAMDVSGEFNSPGSPLRTPNENEMQAVGSSQSPSVSECSIFERDVEDLRSGSNISMTNLASLMSSKRSISNIGMSDQQDSAANANNYLCCTPIQLVKGAEGQGHHFRLSALEDCVSPALDATCSVVTDRRADLNRVNIVYSDSTSTSTYGLGMALGVSRPRSALSFSSRRNCESNSRVAGGSNQGLVSPLSHEGVHREPGSHSHEETLNFYSYFDMISDEYSSSIVPRISTPIGRSQSSPYYRSASRNHHKTAGVRSALGNASSRPRSGSHSVQSAVTDAKHASSFIIQAPTPVPIRHTPESPDSRALPLDAPNSVSLCGRNALLGKAPNSGRGNFTCSPSSGDSESESDETQGDSDCDGVFVFPGERVKPAASAGHSSTRGHVFIRSTTPANRGAVRSSSVSSHLNTSYLNSGRTSPINRSGSALWSWDVMDRSVAIPPHPLHTENLGVVLRRQLSDK